MLAENIRMTKTPYILILASCYSHRSEVSNVLRSSGIYSVLHISEDLGKLTRGKSFLLSQEQRDLLQLVSTHLNMKDIIIFGEKYFVFKIQILRNIVKIYISFHCITHLIVDRFSGNVIYLIIQF